MLDILRGVLHLVVYIAHGGWGYTLGVIETGHVGWNRYFVRCLEGSNDDPVVGDLVGPVVDILEREQHIPVGPGRTSFRRTSFRKKRQRTERSNTASGNNK